MNFVIANILYKKSMRESRGLIYKYSREIREDRTRKARAIFQNSYVNINHALGLLKVPDRINPNLSRRDIDLILEQAKAELKKYQRIGHYYIKWEWNWNTEHSILILILIEIIIQIMSFK